MDWYLSLDRCDQHGMQALSLNHNGSGTRLTRGKCCGRWREVQKWPLTGAEMREIANEFECAADQAEEIDA